LVTPDFLNQNLFFEMTLLMKGKQKYITKMGKKGGELHFEKKKSKKKK
jgi:hypothetical protein